MPIDEQKLSYQLSGNIDGQVQVIYRLLAHANLPERLQVQFGAHGYIERELRFTVGDRWYFSAVLNKSWVLWYFRRPAISDLGLDLDELLQTFPTAEVTSANEVKVRVPNLEMTYAILGWLFQRV